MSDHAAAEGAETPLPSLDDLSTSEGGYDTAQVSAAFDAFLREVAALRSELNILRAREGDPGWMGRAARREAIDVIQSSVELAEKIERDAHAAAEAQRARVDDELRDRLAELERQEHELARLTHEHEQRREHLLAEARLEAGEHAAAVLAEAQGKAEELLEGARAQAEQMIERARDAARQLYESGRGAPERRDAGPQPVEPAEPEPSPEPAPADPAALPHEAHAAVDEPIAVPTPGPQPGEAPPDHAPADDADREHLTAHPPATFPSAGRAAPPQPADVTGAPEPPASPLPAAPVPLAAAPTPPPAHWDPLAVPQPPLSPHDLARALGLSPAPPRPESPETWPGHARPDAG